MSPTEIQMIVDRLSRIEDRLNGVVTWKMLLAALTAFAAVVTALITGGTLLWG
ncbi:hypothetical protein CLV30_109194 [Haloactinopolyspora alba]|uniref:Uncharacterized protein n=1 Tax=Haloactinopolyspora alba TaxID=648780 RepID=A0A2P8E089_9ACTN|nr:hypothetical protein [Haloactinopolyspora alba]PSL02886.1 hypothetical protein CLV30_109194 [Haloactinopolyspora alba]